jgi:hypothetical protein
MAVMRDPVVAPSGVTYDRGALLAHLRRSGTDPATGQPLRSDRLYANLAVRDAICKWAVERMEARERRRRAAKEAGAAKGEASLGRPASEGGSGEDDFSIAAG